MTAKDDPFEPGLDNGPGTHGAWFECNIKRTAIQSPGCQNPASPFESQAFGVSRRVMKRLSQVEGLRDNAFLTHDNGTDRHFTEFRSRFRQFQSPTHPVRIIG